MGVVFSDVQANNFRPTLVFLVVFVVFIPNSDDSSINCLQCYSNTPYSSIQAPYPKTKSEDEYEMEYDTLASLSGVIALCRENQWEKVLACIKEQPDLGSKIVAMENYITTTIIHKAITSKGDAIGRAEVISTILRQTPAAARLKNGYGSLPLHVIAQRNTKMSAKAKEAIIKELIGAYPEAVTQYGGIGGRTPLHIIFTDYVSPRLTKFVLDHGAQACFMKDKKGFLPAHVACSRHCSPEKLRMLLNVNPNALFELTSQGDSLLDLARATATKSHPNYALIKELVRQMDIYKGPVNTDMFCEDVNAPARYSPAPCTSLGPSAAAPNAWDRFTGSNSPNEAAMEEETDPASAVETSVSPAVDNQQCAPYQDKVGHGPEENYQQPHYQHPQSGGWVYYPDPSHYGVQQQHTDQQQPHPGSPEELQLQYVQEEPHPQYVQVYQEYDQSHPQPSFGHPNSQPPYEQYVQPQPQYEQQPYIQPHSEQYAAHYHQSQPRYEEPEVQIQHAHRHYDHQGHEYQEAQAQYELAEHQYHQPPSQYEHCEPPYEQRRHEPEPEMVVSTQNNENYVEGVAQATLPRDEQESDETRENELLQKMLIQAEAPTETEPETRKRKAVETPEIAENVAVATEGEGKRHCRRGSLGETELMQREESDLNPAADLLLNFSRAQNKEVAVEETAEADLV